MFEYQDDLDGVVAEGEQCPPPAAHAIARKAWRWVNLPMTAECFKPVAMRNPRRLLQEDDPKKRCSCWALSMHDTEAQSIAAFKALEKKFKQIRKTIGSAVAYAELSPLHGASTLSDSYGHFDLHPYKTTGFPTPFSAPKAIP
jgi:hypothetical protein